MASDKAEGSVLEINKITYSLEAGAGKYFCVVCSLLLPICLSMHLVKCNNKLVEQTCAYSLLQVLKLTTQ